MLKWFKDWKRRGDESLMAEWRSIFAKNFVYWVFDNIDPPITVYNITKDQCDKLELAMDHYFHAYLYGVGITWKSYSRAEKHLSIKLMNETILGMLKNIQDSPRFEEPAHRAYALLNFIKD